MADNVPKGALFVPEPKVGDRGVYLRGTATTQPDGRIITESSKVAIAFEWLAPEQFLDGHGRPHLTHPVAAWVGGGVLFRFDAEDRRVVSTTTASNFTSRFRIGDEPVQLLNETVTVDSLYTAFGGLAFCGLRAPAQGAKLDLDREVDLLDACFIDSVVEPNKYRAVGANRMGNLRTIVFASLGDPALLVWYTEGNPYPVLLLKPTAPGTYQSYELVDYRPGNIEFSQPPGSPQPAAPPVHLAPTKNWGPDEVGVDHPFPFSEAYEYALNDPDRSTLRDFMRDHPKAFVWFASGGSSIRGQVTTHSWKFIVTDGERGKDSTQVCLKKHIEPIGWQVTAELGVYAPYTTTSYSYTTLCLLLVFPGPPTREQIPDALPTVRSVFERFDLLRAPESIGRATNHWGFIYQCRGGDETCPEAVASVSGGIHVDEFPTSTIEPDPSERKQISFKIGVDKDGHVTWLQESRVAEWSHASFFGLVQGKKPDEHERGPISAMSFQAPRASSIWAPPVGFLIGVGALAGILGALYWSWPYAARLPLFGAFSRVEKPRALHQPTRGHVMDTIVANPGIHFQALVRAAGLPGGTVRHHVAKLLDVGLAVEYRTAGYACFFPAGRVDRNIAAAQPHLKADGARKLLRLVVESPGRTGRELAMAARLTPPSVSYHLRRLAAAGLVTQEHRGRVQLVRPTALAVSALATAGS